MIHESYYWKKELIVISKKIQSRIKIKKNWTMSNYAKFEKKVMFGFYIIRKLMEAKKLPNKIGASKIACIKYLNNGKSVTWLNNHRYHENYDFENPVVEQQDLKFFINQFIHSYIFSPIIDLTNKECLVKLESDILTDEEKSEIYESEEKELKGLHINSNKNKNEFLFEIDITNLYELFEEIGKSKITRTEWKFNPKKGDYDVLQFDEDMTIPKEIEVLLKT